MLLLATTLVVAQNDRHKKIKALKVAHITEQLDLTPQEAGNFWPIYNASEEKMEAIRKKERKEIMSKIRNGIESLTDAEANELIDKSIALKRQELELYSQLVVDLKGKLPPKKIILLRKAEDDFKRKLLDRFKNRRKNR